MNIGDKKNKLILVEILDEIDNSGHIMGTFLCDCINYKKIRISRVNSEETKSCGCVDNVTKHNLSNSKEYKVWSGIKKRCFNKKDKSYKNYGGRGISVCERWLNKENGFINFYEDMGNIPIKNYSIERRNNNEGYSPENCYWASKKEQANNNRKNIKIEFNGEIKTISEWADFYNIKYSTLQHRVTIEKLSLEEAISKPIKKIIKDNPKYITYNNKTQTLIEWSRELNMSYKALQLRIKRDKWSIEKTFTTPIRKVNK